MQSAEARVMLFESRQSVQGVGYPAREPLRDRRQQQCLALLRRPGQQRSSGGKGTGELVAPQKKKGWTQLKVHPDFTAMSPRRLERRSGFDQNL
jgi:hypothetical protein